MIAHANDLDLLLERVAARREAALQRRWPGLVLLAFLVGLALGVLC